LDSWTIDWEWECGEAGKRGRGEEGKRGKMVSVGIPEGCNVNSPGWNPGWMKRNAKSPSLYVF